MNRWVVFGVLAGGLVAGAAVAVKIGSPDGDDEKQAAKGCLIGLGAAGTGLWAYHRLRKGKDQEALPST